MLHLSLLYTRHTTHASFLRSAFGKIDDRALGTGKKTLFAHKRCVCHLIIITYSSPTPIYLSIKSPLLCSYPSHLLTTTNHHHWRRAPLSTLQVVPFACRRARPLSLACAPRCSLRQCHPSHFYCSPMTHRRPLSAAPRRIVSRIQVQSVLLGTSAKPCNSCSLQSKRLLP